MNNPQFQGLVSQVVTAAVTALVTTIAAAIHRHIAKKKLRKEGKLIDGK